MKWRVYATIVGSKYVGDVEAATKEEAIELGERMADTPSLCHQCSAEIENAEVDEISVDEVTGGEEKS